MKNTVLKLTAFAAGCLAAFSSFAQDVAVRAADTLHFLAFSHVAMTGGILGLNKLPTAADFDSRRVTNMGQSEIVRQRFYDSLLFPAAGAQTLSFFSTPVGSGITSAPGGTVGTTKTLWDTNLVLPNQLPSGVQFLIESIELIFLPGTVSTANTFTMATPAFGNAVATATMLTAMNDTYTFYNSGLLELNILSKNYLREMTQAFPPKASFEARAGGFSNSATTMAGSAGYGRQQGRAYYLDPEISLQPAVNFSVSLTYPAAVAPPSGFNGRVTCVLDGYFMRASQ